MRRAFYDLPIGWLIPLGEFKRRLLRHYDWTGAVSELRLKESDYLETTIRANRTLPDRKRIAFYQTQHFSPVEYGMAMALQLRGHSLSGILCDGLLPLCELNLGPTIRPPCEVCIKTLSRPEEAFGFEYDRLKQFLLPEDLEQANELVENTPVELLKELVVDGVPVGVLASRELQRYYRGFVFEPAKDPAFKTWLISGVLHTWLSQRWLDSVQPEIVGVCSGRTLPTACIFEIARQRGIPIVTWDGVASRPDGLMFSHNSPATEIPLDDAWTQHYQTPLSSDQNKQLDEYLDDWAKSKNTPFPYNPNPVDNETEIRSQLGLRADVPLVVAFTNTSWDIAVIDRDVGFDNMFDWLFQLVQSATRRKDIDLVVRAHPAEKKVPAELQSRTPVATEIRKRFPLLPDNIKIVEGDDPISSYALAELAQVNMIYASRLGLELSLRGMRPWIAGAVTYRAKGFTLDLASADHMVQLLNTNTFENRLAPHEIQLARRFAYLWLFRYEIPLPLLHPSNKRFALSTFQELGPGGNQVIENLCEAFVTGKPFIDIARNDTNE